ncbi:MAG: rubrerythrin family protein [Chloroflexota bacterium]|nr:rubrerythrin family protein [Chloroflexota bacterium]
MHKMTQANLGAAFAGESQAHIKYLAFSAQAEKEGFPNVGRLFQAIAYAERVHATSHLKTLKGVGKTADNLEAAIGGETYEVEEMYPAFIAVAKVQEEKAAVRSNEWALEAEKIHAEMYGAAKEAVEGGKDAEVGQVYVCEICGWTGEGEPPDECPLCKAKKEKFITF